MKEEKEQITNSALKWGILSAFLASLCCIGPLVLVLLGAGSASTALAIGYNKPYFLIFGLAVLIIGFSFLYRKSCNTTKLSKKQQVFIFGGSFLVAALLYYLLTSVIVPIVAPRVYQSRSVLKILSSFSNSKLHKATFAIDGMWCTGCAVAAENALKEKAGIVNAAVGFKKNLEGVGEVIYNPEEIGLEEIVKAVEPYKAKVINDVQATALELKDLPK